MEYTTIKIKRKTADELQLFIINNRPDYKTNADALEYIMKVFKLFDPIEIFHKLAEQIPPKNDIEEQQ